jgi:hypothetical protein
VPAACGRAGAAKGDAASASTQRTVGASAGAAIRRVVVRVGMAALMG